jgi:hypothetical protein
LVALDLRESRYLAVNRTGKVLWEGLADGATRDDLVERLVDTFGVDRARAETDVDTFTAELESRGLLTREGSDA